MKLSPIIGDEESKYACCSRNNLVIFERDKTNNKTCLMTDCLTSMDVARIIANGLVGVTLQRTITRPNKRD